MIKILKSRAVRATGLFWNKDNLINMVATPDHFVEDCNANKGVYPFVPPLELRRARSEDEAASDPPSDLKKGGGELFSAEKPKPKESEPPSDPYAFQLNQNHPSHKES